MLDKPKCPDYIRRGFWSQFFTYRCQLLSILASLPLPLLPPPPITALKGQQFLETTASQLTYHGICELNSQLKEGDLGVFFRNNHFNTLMKRKVCAYFVYIYNYMGGGGARGSRSLLLDPPPLYWSRIFSLVPRLSSVNFCFVAGLPSFYKMLALDPIERISEFGLRVVCTDLWVCLNNLLY